MKNHDETLSDQEAMEKFETLLDEYHYATPREGDILEGTVSLVQEDAILINVGLKRTAVVPPRETHSLPEDFVADLEPGDSISVFVDRTPVGGENLVVSIDRAVQHQNWMEAEKLLKQEETIELRVSGYNKGGLLVEFARLEGFVPNSQIPGVARIHDRADRRRKKQAFIGQQLKVSPIDVDRTRRRLIFSALAAREELEEERMRELRVGETIEGRIASVVKFGVFVDLGGVDGLVHISELGWGRIGDPNEQFTVGDPIEVLVQEVDLERGRISLSRKALLASPWEGVDGRYDPGDVVEAEIVKILDFGAFAEVEPGVVGLIRTMELGYPGNAEDVQAGDTVLAAILSLDEPRERMALSMRQVPQQQLAAWKAEASVSEEAEAEAEAEPETETGTNAGTAAHDTGEMEAG